MAGKILNWLVIVDLCMHKNSHRIRIWLQAKILNRCSKWKNSIIKVTLVRQQSHVKIRNVRHRYLFRSEFLCRRPCSYRSRSSAGWYRFRRAGMDSTNTHQCRWNSHLLQKVRRGGVLLILLNQKVVTSNPFT